MLSEIIESLFVSVEYYDLEYFMMLDHMSSK
jgi:hypothetical protein